MSICNAKITSTRIEFNHGCAVAWVMLDYGGSGQGFGGSILDDKPEETGKERKATAWGMDYIFSIIRTVGVEKWEDLPGKHVRVERTTEGFDGLITGIGNIIEDKWFRPSELARKHGMSE
jgi:hypothetical protein